MRATPVWPHRGPVSSRTSSTSEAMSIRAGIWNCGFPRASSPRTSSSTMSNCRQATARLSSVSGGPPRDVHRRRWRSMASRAPVMALRSSCAKPAASWPSSRCRSPVTSELRSDASSTLSRSTPLASRSTSSIGVAAAVAATSVVPNSPCEIRSTCRSMAEILAARRPVAARPRGTSTARVAVATASTGQAAASEDSSRPFTGVSTSARSGRTPEARTTPTACRRPAMVTLPPLPTVSSAPRTASRSA